MGSSRPNLRRRFARTSGGTFGFVASSSNGSPGASASTVNRTMLIPRRLGIAMSRRRVRYRLKSGRPSRLPPPVLQGRGVVVPAADLEPHLARYRRGLRPVPDRGPGAIRAHELVDADEQCRALDRIELRLRRAIGLVDLVVAPAGDVAALPLVLLAGDLPGHELVHEHFRVRLRHGRVVHLDVAPELRISVRVGDVRREEHRGGDRLQLEVDPGFLARLLDDGLVLLPRGVDRGLVDELQLLAVLLADAVGAALPAARVEELVRLLDVELELHGLGAEALRVVEEVRRRDAGAAIDVLLHRLAVDQEAERLADGGV